MKYVPVFQITGVKSPDKIIIVSFETNSFKKPQVFQTASTVMLHACVSLQNTLIPYTGIARVQIPDGELMWWIGFPTRPEVSLPFS